MKIVNKKIELFLFFLVLVFIPFLVNASDYETESMNANNYIQRSSYIDTYSRYLFDGSESFKIPFAFNNGTLSTRDEFVYGGLLNKDEYLLSKDKKGNSYLYDGASYWTMTENGSNVFTISYSGENETSKSSSDYLGRATEFVRPGTSVSGSGSVNDPWTFDSMYNIKFETDQSRATFISLNNRILAGDEKHNVDTYVLGKCNTSGCIADIVVEPKSGYQYIANDCNGRYDKNSKHLMVSNINRDLTCSIKFGVGFFKISFDEEAIENGVKPTDLYLQMNESFYKNKNATDVIRKIDMPHRTGYVFNGFYYDTIKVIDENGNISDSAKYSIKNDTVLRTEKHAINYKINYNLDGGNIISGSLPESIQYDKPLNINNPAKAGYEFIGWTFTGIDTSTAMSGSSSTNINRHITNQNDLNKFTYFKNLSSSVDGQIGLKANWSQCVAGTYSDSTKSSCVVCPTGYTSAAGANSINKCYINVVAGYYLKTANTTTKEVCPNGQYSTGGNVYYGSISKCNACPTGYTDGTALDNKTAENKCLRNVAAGNYVASAKATSNTVCATGYYKGAHSVTYGQTSSCTQCPAGYRDGTAVANKTSQGSCARSVPSGYYVASSNATSNTACANGYYRGAHLVTYGSTSACTQCPAGYRDGTQIANKASESTCLRSVPGGYYVASAKATSNTVCGTGRYKGTHTVTYGSTSSCSTCAAGSYQDSTTGSVCKVCPSGYTSSAGASSCSTRCSNRSGVSSWVTPTWNSNNTVSYSCTINRCSALYTKTGNTCVYSYSGGSGGSDSGGGGGGNCCDYGTCCCAGWCACNGGCSGPSGCFLQGTKVMTINGYKDIDKIKAGEMVLTYNEKTHKNEYKRVIKPLVHNKLTEHLYTLVIDGKELKVTEGHHFYIKNEFGMSWIAARDLRLNDYVTYSDGTYHKIEKISYELQTNTVYNLSVEGNHNYYVSEDEILVHNVYK